MNDFNRISVGTRSRSGATKNHYWYVQLGSNKRQAAEFLATIPGQMADINVFSVSFCEDDDLLSQWRGYNGGSYGYCIGFQSAALIR